MRKSSHIIVSLILFALLVFPSITFAVWSWSFFGNSGGSAQSTAQNQTSISSSPSANINSGVTGLIILAGSWLRLLMPIFISLAVVWFVWNVFRYIIVDTDAEKTAAKLGIFWGIVAIFVMVSIWGLIGILQSTFGINTTISPNTANNVLGPFQGGPTSQQ